MSRGNSKNRKKGMNVNVTEFSEIIGYSRNSILQWIKDGMPIIEGGDNGKAYQIDTSEAINWLMTRNKNRTAERDGDANYDYDRARKMSADADKSEMERDVLNGQLVQVDLVAGFVAERLGALRARLLNLPTKLCVKLAAAKKREDCKDILEEGLFDALKEISNRN